MAHPLYNPKKGNLTYIAYQPQKAGVVIEHIKVEGKHFGLVKIKMLNGEIVTVSENGLQDFNALIEDHKKKLATHLATLGKLKIIKETI